MKQRTALCPSILYNPCPSIVTPVTLDSVTVLVKRMSAVSWTVAPSVRAAARAAGVDTETTHACETGEVPVGQLSAHVAATPAEYEPTAQAEQADAPVTA